MKSHPRHLHGHAVSVVSSDGSPLPMPLHKDTVNVAPSETWDIEFAANNPGVWAFHRRTPHQISPWSSMSKNRLDPLGGSLPRRQVPASHRVFDSSPNKNPVSRVARNESNDHCNLHHEPVRGLRRCYGEQPAYDPHPSKHPDFIGDK